MSELVSYLSAHFGVFLLVLVRIASLFISFPFFSTPFIPPNVKVLLVLSLSFFILPYINGSVDLTQLSLLEFSLLVLKEALIGIFLSLVAFIFYSITIYAAELISYMMGLTVANMFDPTFGMVSVLGRLFVLTFYAIFFSTGAYRVFIGALFESFKVVPVGSFTLSEPLYRFFVKEGALLFFLSFKMAFPFILALFLTNLALALINRLIPQINVFIVGLPVQLFIGLFLLTVGFSALIYFTRGLVERFIEEFLSVFKILGG